jgi:phage gpG-like protein
VTTTKIEVTGLREFQQALKRMDTALPRQLRTALNEASGLVIDYAGARMPSRSGRARGSLKARSSQREARVALGGRRAPYAAWLDFGGEGKRKGRPAARPFYRDGRYVYKALEVKRDEITKIMSESLTRLARDAGLDVT